MYQEMQIEALEMKRRTPVDMTDEAPHPGRLRNSIKAAGAGSVPAGDLLRRLETFEGHRDD